MLLAMFLIMMSLMMMTQASCEADVLSCYYLDALNKTEAVLLVTIFSNRGHHHHHHHPNLNSQVAFDDPESMFEATITAELRGAIIVPQNFSHRF